MPGAGFLGSSRSGPLAGSSSTSEADVLTVGAAAMMFSLLPLLLVATGQSPFGVILQKPGTSQ